MKNRIELREGYTLEVPQLQEAAGDRKWTADVWKLDEINLNGRIYSTELATRICAENPKTTARDGHDSEWRTGEEYAGTKAICMNPRIEDRKLKVDIKFIDKEYEALLVELASYGIPIGVSSVGYGEVDESGLVIPETYQLVRFLDFVTTPAGEVYANMKKEGIKTPDPVGKESSTVVDLKSLACKILRNRS